jgi:hypothetical protein
MYLVLIGNAARRHWSWAVPFAMGLELGMVFTPYPKVFGKALTACFVIVPLAAHTIFGVGMGVSARGIWRRNGSSVARDSGSFQWSC